MSARRMTGYWVVHHPIPNGRWLYAERQMEPGPGVRERQATLVI